MEDFTHGANYMLTQITEFVDACNPTALFYINPSNSNHYMKKSILFLSIMSLLLSCSKKDCGFGDNCLVGEWKLIEQLADPGDGSGVFTQVESDKTILFKKSGKLNSNGNMCTMSSSSDESSNGTWSADNNILTIEDCSASLGEGHITFEVSGEFLILHYLCIEGCAQKYRRVN